MLKKISIVGMGLAMALAVSQSAMADDAGQFSAGISGGWGNIDGFDNSALGFKFYGGYQIAKNIALEAGYARITGDGDVSGINVTGTDDVLYVAPTVNVDLTPQITGFVKANLAYNMASAEATACDIYGCYKGTADTNEFKVGWGIGGEWKFDKKLKFRAEYETFAADVKMFSIGLRSEF